MDKKDVWTTRQEFAQFLEETYKEMGEHDIDAVCDNYFEMVMDELDEEE
ncbi:MAG: hypothetical protein LPK26_04785 [Bacillaceae bacterium]|nr:hypothetical protein [Bacillaceae bacterium]